MFAFSSLSINEHPTLRKIREMTGESYINRHQDRDYEAALMEGLSMAEQFDAHSLIAQSHVAIAERPTSKGDPLNACHHLDIARAIYDTLDLEKHDYWWVCLMHALYGVAYDDLAEFPKALLHHRRSLEIAREIDDPYSIARAFINLGWIYSQMGEGDQAISYLIQVTKYTEFPKYSSGGYDHLADVHKMMGHFELAKKYYWKALESLESDKSGKIKILTQIVSCCIELEQYEKAEKYLSDLQIICTQIKRAQVFPRVDILLVRAQLAVAYADYSLAMEICQQALHITHKHRNEVDRLWIIHQQASIWFASGHIARCRSELLALLEEKLPYNLRLLTRKLLINVYKATGDWQDAFELLENISANKFISQSKLLALQDLLNSQTQEKALRDKNEQLNELSREKDELLQIVAHDLKNPLSAARTTLDLILKQPNHFSVDWIIMRLNRVNGVITRAFEIISQLTTASMLEAATEDSTQNLFAPIELARLVDEIVRENVILAEDKQQTLTFSNASTSTVYGNELWLRQIVSNLISNAIKYSNSDSETVVSLHDCVESQSVYLEVEDEGLGLDENDLRGMFGKYNRLSSSPTGGEASVGLGLYIVKMLTEKLGGTITVESPGKNCGSTFSVKLPRIN